MQSSDFNYFTYGVITVPFPVDVYCIDPIVYNQIPDESKVGKNARNVSRALKLYPRHVVSFNVYPRVIESLNFIYTEKFVPGLDYAFPLYNIGFKPHLGLNYLMGFASSRGIRTSSGLRYPLISKYFSGDVSGVIGESLFVYVALLVYGVHSIIHLRPEKVRLPTSDFVVTMPRDIVRLSPLLCQRYVYPSNNSRLFVECKSTVNTEIDHYRVKHGLFQLYNMLNSGDFGLLFVVHKDWSTNRFVVKTVPLIRR